MSIFPISDNRLRNVLDDILLKSGEKREKNKKLLRVEIKYRTSWAQPISYRSYF